MVRTLVGMLLLLALAGCDRLDTSRLPDCPLCRLQICSACEFGHGESFAADADFGLLAFGVTVRLPASAPAKDKEKLVGGIEWLVETAEETNDRRTIDLPDGIKPGQRVVVVWRGPPGLWSFRQARWRQGDRNAATLPFSSRALATQVKAGEATYAGELIIDGTQLSLIGDEAQGRAAFAGYPGIAVPPRFRPLRDIRARKSGGDLDYDGVNSNSDKRAK